MKSREIGQYWGDRDGAIRRLHDSSATPCISMQGPEVAGKENYLVHPVCVYDTFGCENTE